MTSHWTTSYTHHISEVDMIINKISLANQIILSIDLRIRNLELNNNNIFKDLKTAKDSFLKIENFLSKNKIDLQKKKSLYIPEEKKDLKSNSSSSSDSNIYPPSSDPFPFKYQTYKGKGKQRQL